MTSDCLLPARISNEETRAGRACLDAFESEFSYICRTLRRLGVPRSDIEDLAHEVFLVLHRRWNDYDPARPLKPWLFGIAFRLASTHRHRMAREIADGTLDVENLSAWPEQAAAAQEARIIVLAALARVPLPRRAIVILHDLDEVPMRDVASALTIPLFTAYSRLRKGRTEFRAAVEAIRKKGTPL